MTLALEVKVPREELFKLISDSIKYDMSLHSKKRFEEGAMYNKTLNNYKGKPRAVTISITALSEECIEFFTASKKLKIKTNYSLDVQGSTTQINYSESLINNGWLEKLNYNIMSFIYQKRNKKKLLHQFRSMENYYLDTIKKNP